MGWGQGRGRLLLDLPERRQREHSHVLGGEQATQPSTLTENASKYTSSSSTVPSIDCLVGEVEEWRRLLVVELNLLLKLAIAIAAHKQRPLCSTFIRKKAPFQADPAAR